MEKERQMIVDKLVSKEAKVWLRKNFKTHWKNSEKARRIRIQGNNMYAKISKNALDMEEVHRLYTESITLAECHSEELAFGYGNRSAILFRMQKYNESITDIDAAMKISKSEEFHVKMLCRRLECMLNQKLIFDSNKFFVEAESLVSAMKDDAKKKSLIQKIEKVKNVCVIYSKPDSAMNKEIPKHIKILNKKEKENPFDSISIKWDKKNGRHLVANRDFKPGEIIFVEKPYVKIPNIKNFYKICGHCLAESWSAIPCSYCSWCLFCSEECKKRSWEMYHNIECAIVNQIIKKRGDISRYDQLTVRALVLGIREAGSIQNLQEKIEKIDACTDMAAKGFQKNGSFQSMGFQSMYILNDINATNLPLYTTNSVLILISLMKYTSLFDENLECNLENLLLNDEMLFIGSLILKLYKIIASNCQHFPNYNECKYDNDRVTCQLNACCSPGFFIVLIQNLINHDCHPQVVNFIGKKSKKFIGCTVTPVKKNSQIFISYFGDVFDVPKNVRQEVLKDAFQFTCKCKPCEENWPTMGEQFNKLKNNRRRFLSMCNPKERWFIDFEMPILGPILMDNFYAEYTLDTVKTVSNLVCKLHKELKHPSFALFRTEKCMFIVLRKLYQDYELIDI